MPAPMLLTCLMGGSEEVLGESKIDTYTYMPACSWRSGLNEEERALQLALAVGHNCDTVFCWSEIASTVPATTPMSFVLG